LLHERVHIRRRDTRWTALIFFLSECGLFPVTNALRLYRQGCEASADQQAADMVGGAKFAAVLVRFAKLSPRIPFSEALTDSEGLEERVRRLREGNFVQPLRWAEWCRICLSFCAIAALSWYSLIAHQLAQQLFGCVP